MKKLLLVMPTVGLALFVNSQTLQNTDKGLEFIQLLEMQLEDY